MAVDSPEEYIARLHVVLISPGRIPARTYGGTERVIAWLAHGLADAGHQVTLLAPRGSQTRFARVIPIDLPRQDVPHWDARPFLPTGFDVVHAHLPWDPAPELPACWTTHGNALPGEVLPPGGWGISANHAARHGFSRWVSNGLDPAEYQFAPAKEPYDLFLGRLHSVKGWRLAVDGARRSHRQLVVAGGWRPSLRRSLRFVGEVGGTAKARWLAGAACLWMPAQWDEPFGLTTIEAMVSGTPVLATSRGALPEIVTPESGVLADTIDAMVLARPRLAALDPHAIRQHVLDHFTFRTMADRYEQLYHEVIAGVR